MAWVGWIGYEPSIVNGNVCVSVYEVVVVVAVAVVVVVDDGSIGVCMCECVVGVIPREEEGCISGDCRVGCGMV